MKPIKEIIERRKLEIRKDMEKFYIYDQIDTSFFYSDSFHGITNRLLRVFDSIGYPNNKKFFNIKYENIEINQTIESDIRYYFGLGYISNKYDKEEYMKELMKIIGIKKIKNKVIADYYPLILPKVLEENKCLKDE